MNRPRLSLLLCIFATWLTACHAADEGRTVFDPTQAGAIDRIKPNEAFGDTSFQVKDGAIEVSVKPNGKSSFPGIVIVPETPWDASGFGHVETTVTNQGPKPLRVHLRVDNEGSDASNTSVVVIKPGESTPISAIFGYSYNKRGYQLDPKAIVRAIVFTGKSDAPQTLRVTALRAAGTVGEEPYRDPNGLAHKPAGGQILGGSASFDPAKQLVAKGGAKIQSADARSFTIAFSPGAQQSVLVRPAVGMWNLNEHLQVVLRMRNAGSTPITPAVELQSRGGSSATFRASSPIAPGTEIEMPISFIAPSPWKGADLPEMHEQSGPARGFKEFEPGTGTQFTSNTATGILISADVSKPASLQVSAIVANMPPREPLPQWLGQRPPVEGDWTLTFDENFDGSTIDLKQWNIYTEGEWHLGRATGYSKDNVIVKDGKLHLRVEKRKVHHNDNPAYPTHDYATGWCDSYGKWTQRYGYFEARLKLPTAPDAFTAFWLMPDRGLEYVNAKKPAYGEPRTFQRNSTNGFGMEFDIMEQLSAWGPNRHDFGMHWDHYMKNHKSIGTFGCYFHPDEDGFVTVGMLWTPGTVVMYQQGRESARWETSRISSLPSYLILQHITGGWETDGMDDAQLPSDLIFDYVRVWQRKDLASPVDGPKPNDGGPLPPQAAAN